MTTKNKGVLLIAVSLIGGFISVPAFAVLQFTIMQLSEPSTALNTLSMILRVLPLLGLIGFIYGIVLVRKK